jgi:hypothetical protein
MTRNSRSTVSADGGSLPGGLRRRTWQRSGVSAIGRALDGTSLSALKEKLAATQQSAENVLASLHLPHLPTRNEIRSRATAMFARTPSIDDIVDQAYRLILDGVGARLCPDS